MQNNLFKKIAEFNNKNNKKNVYNNVDISDDDIMGMLEEIKDNKTIKDFDDLESQFLKIADEYLKDLFNDYFLSKKLGITDKLSFSDYDNFRKSLERFRRVEKEVKDKETGETRKELKLNLFNTKENKTFYLGQLLKGDNNSLEAVGRIIAFRNNVSKTIKNFIKSVLNEFVDKKGLDEQILKYTKIGEVILFREEDFFQDIIYQDYYKNAGIVSNIENFIKYGKYNYFDENAENKFIFENSMFAQQMLLNYNKRFESSITKRERTFKHFSSKGGKSIIIGEKEQEIIYSFKNPKQKEYNKKQLLTKLENSDNPEKEFKRLYDFYHTVRQVDNILEKFESQIDNYLRFIFGDKIKVKGRDKIVFGNKSVANTAILEQYTKLKEIFMQASTNIFNKEANTVQIGNDNSVKNNKEVIGKKIYRQIEIPSLGSKLYINLEEDFASIKSSFEGEIIQDNTTRKLNPKFEQFIIKDLRNIKNLEKVKNSLLGDTRHKLFARNINVSRKAEEKEKILQDFKGKDYTRFDLDIL